MEILGRSAASSVDAPGRGYIPGRDGTTQVIAHRSRYAVVASNTLDDRFDASPAIVADMNLPPLYFTHEGNPDRPRAGRLQRYVECGTRICHGYGSTV